MRAERLSPYARPPRAYRDLHLRHSTVDAFGGAHRLLTEHANPPAPYDALVVTVTDGCSRAAWLGPVPARFPRLGSAPSRTAASSGPTVQEGPYVERFVLEVEAS
ncbi:hypothetical protein ACIOK4_04550 [Streptomyces bottropensis]|uniref:hypothetical protein n=1 Tax=Streptomyces bottropensis TaxID=42235 RepID=UPI0036BE5534